MPCMEQVTKEAKKGNTPPFLGTRDEASEELEYSPLGGESKKRAQRSFFGEGETGDILRPAHHPDPTLQVPQPQRYREFPPHHIFAGAKMQGAAARRVGHTEVPDENRSRGFDSPPRGEYFGGDVERRLPVPSAYAERFCRSVGLRESISSLMSRFATLFLMWTMAIFTSPSLWANEQSPEALLHARGAEFEKAVLEVTEGVYTAVGYTIAPVSMIVGDGGLIIVDTGVDVPSAREVLADFRKISQSQVKAVILTHGHTDHSGGLAVFLEDGTEVWAGPDFGAENRFAMNVGLTINLQRGLAQFGYALPPEHHINMGIGKHYVPREMGEGEQRRENLAGVAGAEPDHTLAPFERRTITVAGIELELVANPAETTDAIYVWVPEKKVLFSGDTFYKSWPNLAPFRGIRYRDIQDYVRSIDALANENAHFLVSGHNRPISGEREIRETLINYRDAIQYLFDKSIEGMNAGLTREELVAEVKLPDEYANLDYLRPYYGHPDWAVRGIYNHFLGWFDGNPTSLFPLSPGEEARRMIELAGGEERLMNQIQRAIQDDDHQWAAQLCDYLLAIQPENSEVKLIKADALEVLAENRLTTTARNYYRTIAQELRREAAASTRN